MAALGLAPGLRTVFDAPRTAAYSSCLVRTEGSGLGSPKEPPVLGATAVGVVKVNARNGGKAVVEKGFVSRSDVVKFIVGCTDSEEEEDGAGIQRVVGAESVLTQPVQDGKLAGLRRCTGTLANMSSDRKRLQSECSSGVSTRFSCSNSSNSSNCSMTSGLTSSDDDDGVDDSSPVVSISSGYVSPGTDVDDACEAFANIATTASATNEGLLAVEYTPSPLKRLVVNPAPSVEIEWWYSVVGGIMVVNAPKSTQKACGISDALVTLLEYGENELHCSRAVILIELDSPEKDSLQRMFSFLGFTILAPKSTPACLRSYSKYVLMVTDFSDLQENDSDLDLEG